MVDWLFRNRRTGTITIAQWPNAALLVFLGAWALGRFVDPTGWPDTALAVVATTALVIWALDELIRGVNPWRRILGGVVLIWQIVGLLTG
jgi:hypothetical protein